MLAKLAEVVDEKIVLLKSARDIPAVCSVSKVSFLPSTDQKYLISFVQDDTDQLPSRLSILS